MTIADSVTKSTLQLFHQFCIGMDFINYNPDEWVFRCDYLHGAQIVKNLCVVNDNAERAVALISEYNTFSTKDEDIKQYLLQVVDDHRRQVSCCSKDRLFSKSQ